MDPSVIFYFDIDDTSLIASLAHHIRKLGGKCTNFFSKDVTHLIVNKNYAKKGEITVKTVPSPSSVPGESTPTSKSHCTLLKSPVTLSSSCANYSLDSVGTNFHKVLPSVESSSIFDRLGASPITPSSNNCFDKNQYYSFKISSAGKENKNPLPNGNRLDAMSGSQRKSTIPFKILASNQQQSALNKNCSPPTLLKQSRTRQKYDLIHKANSMNTHIWSIEQLYHYLQKCYGEHSEELLLTPQNSSKEKKTSDCNLFHSLLVEERQSKINLQMMSASLDETNTKLPAQSLNPYNLRQSSRLASATISKTLNPLSYYVFEHPFVLIEDSHGIHRPYFKEYRQSKSCKNPGFPTLYLNSLPGHCPFIKPTLVSKKTKIAEELLANENEPLAANKNSNSNSKSPSPSTTQQYLSSKKLPLIKTTNKIKRPGYCECCIEKYSDMEEHSQQSFHRKFATCDANFANLDKLMQELRRPLAISSSSLSNTSLSVVASTKNSSTLETFTESQGYKSPSNPFSLYYDFDFISSSCATKRKYGVNSITSRSLYKKQQSEKVFFEVLAGPDSELSSSPSSLLSQGETNLIEETHKKICTRPRSPLYTKYNHGSPFKMLSLTSSRAQAATDNNTQALFLFPEHQNLLSSNSIPTVPSGSNHRSFKECFNSSSLNTVMI